MATAKKTPAGSAPKKPTAKKPRARRAPAPVVQVVAAPVPQAKIIRNLRNCPVHLRLMGPLSEKPYRVELKPLGIMGDTTAIPATLVDTTSFIMGEGVLFEVITETEARQAQYAQVGYQQREALTVIRDEDTVISTADNWDGKGIAPKYNELRRDSQGHTIPENDRALTGAGPAYANVPGSNQALHAGLQAGAREAARPNADTMIPDGALRAPLVIERVKGQ